METSNRQGKISECSIESPSDKVAMITGRAKFGCDELTAEEWVTLIKIALAIAKPYLEYTSYFRSLNSDTSVQIKSFRLTRNDRNRSGHFSVDEGGNYIIKSFEKYADIETAAIIIHYPVLQICEVNIPGREGISAKIMLTQNGELAVAECERNGEDPLSQAIPVIKKAYLLDNDEKMLPFFQTYTQLGPLTLMVISCVLNFTYNYRMLKLQNMGRAGEKVESFIQAIEMDGRLVINHQWGILGMTKGPPKEQPVT